MAISFSFIFYSVMLGFGLAMDAFSVSVANGLNDPGMNRSRLLWIALILLVFIGSRMIWEAFHEEEEMDEKLGSGELLMQGVATSIDALSVGFTIAEYDFKAALTASLLIGLVTFFVCAAGVRIGMVFRMRLSRYASIVGGLILIAIGIAIFIG